MSKKESLKAKAKGSIAGRLIYGQVISSDFFARHWLKVFAVFTVIMVFITNKYHCQTKMEEIRRLNNELEIVKTGGMRSVYMSRTRESEMQQLVDSLGLNLHVQQRPPYKLPAR